MLTWIMIWVLIFLKTFQGEKMVGPKSYQTLYMFVVAVFLELGINKYQALPDLFRIEILTQF